MNSHSDETEVVQRLFQQHVPAVASGTVEIRGVVREPGNRCIMAVVSKDPAVDAVGACVGTRGSRVKLIVEELAGEHVDIVLWNPSLERFLANMLAPLRFLGLSFDEATYEARIQLARGEELPAPDRLALRSKLLLQLTGWNLTLEFENENQ